jgi:hypothetical protein
LEKLGDNMTKTLEMNLNRGERSEIAYRLIKALPVKPLSGVIDYLAQGIIPSGQEASKEDMEGFLRECKNWGLDPDYKWQIDFLDLADEQLKVQSHLFGHSKKLFMPGQSVLELKVVIGPSISRHTWQHFAGGSSLKILSEPPSLKLELGDKLAVLDGAQLSAWFVEANERYIPQ